MPSVSGSALKSSGWIRKRSAKDDADAYPSSTIAITRARRSAAAFSVILNGVGSAALFIGTSRYTLIAQVLSLCSMMPIKSILELVTTIFAEELSRCFT
jgi:hypothetical protein